MFNQYGKYKELFKDLCYIIILNIINQVFTTNL